VNIHEKYIKRCIEIAKNGLGSSRPNPMVGCIIVHKNNIIGEGFTSPYGRNHAEVNAINSVVDKHLLKDSTLYVTLEPCSHFGKTPPCSDLIIKHQIPNVVIGCIDDNIKVAGKGIEKLKNAGCQVTVGVLEAECKEHHKRFFTFHNKKRPYIILKWAETKDGFIAPETKKEQKPVWISNEYSRLLTHKWRAEEQAILVGTNTVLQDNPSLTVREWTGQNPIRVVIDKDLKLPENLAVFNDEAQTIVISKNDVDFSKDVAIQICGILFQKDINSVIIEGGKHTLQTFIDENHWDEARIFIGDAQFKKGVKAPKFNGRLISEENIMGDILKTYKND
jgi:diaminohydroxyphosphoribosylaminopyrimidine deaminase / 5-amino-6-(5-phosphoribosylamino)uracil reductase